MKNSCIVVFTLDNPFLVVGGVQKYILNSFEVLKTHHIHQLTVFPLPNKMRKFLPKSESHFGIYQNKTFLGIYSFLEVLKMMKAANILEFHIHHFMNLSFSFISTFLREKNIPIRMFIHDYYTICPSYNLLFNLDHYCDVHYKSDVCTKCDFFHQHEEIQKKMNGFLEEFANRLNIYAPSEVTKEIWIHNYSTHSNLIQVLPLTKFQMIKKKIARNQNVPIRIAYVGAQLPHKGWNDFKNIVSEFSNQYDFYYIGNEKEYLDSVKNRYVTLKNGKSSMTEVLKEENIDVVFLWSKCPETYSFVMFECIQAGAFIITNPDSGNIQDFTIKNKLGKVFETLADVKEYFRNDLMPQDLNEFQKEQLFLEQNRFNEELLNKLPFKESTTQEVLKYQRSNFFTLLYQLKMRRDKR